MVPATDATWGDDIESVVALCRVSKCASVGMKNRRVHTTSEFPALSAIDDHPSPLVFAIPPHNSRAIRADRRPFGRLLHLSSLRAHHHIVLPPLCGSVDHGTVAPKRWSSHDVERCLPLAVDDHKLPGFVRRLVRENSRRTERYAGGMVVCTYRVMCFGPPSMFLCLSTINVQSELEGSLLTSRRRTAADRDASYTRAWFRKDVSNGLASKTFSTRAG